MLEKQYSRIIRWVNRAQSMSADGYFSDAILDVECARAELDDARQELLLCHQEGCERKQIPKALLATLGSVFAVLVWAVPLHWEETSAFIQVAESSRIETNTRVATIAESARQTTPAEIDAAETIATVACVKVEVSEPALIEAKAEPALQKRAGSKKNARAVSQRAATRLSAADMIRLTEVGRRALQKDRSILVLELN